ncbi:MAG: HAD family hydrolase [Inquilinus sp.]|nr:HAD family hydrolase [Inquilinus sp.]
MVDVIAFDGDDTLWHNETVFSLTQEKFRDLLCAYAPQAEIDAALLATETRNLRLFGYGIKGFTLSMIESAIELTRGRVSATDIHTMIEAGKDMLEHPVELLDGVRETVEWAARDRRAMVITKGDLFDQESKLARSGLADLLWKVEIVSEKDPDTYRRILEIHEIDPGGFLMVGNSVKSDILPVLEAGGRAVHIPYEITWAHEHVEPDPAATFPTLEHIRQLPELVKDGLP